MGALLRFRQYSFALVGDIKSMFLQMLVEEKDRDALRFLWFKRTTFSNRWANFECETMFSERKHRHAAQHLPFKKPLPTVNYFSSVIKTSYVFSKLCFFTFPYGVEDTP